MDKEELAEHLNKSEEEIDEILEDIKEYLKSQNKLVTPTTFRDRTGLHHERFKKTVSHLVGEDDDVVVIPSSTKGQLLAHRDNVQNLVDDALA